MRDYAKAIDHRVPSSSTSAEHQAGERFANLVGRRQALAQERKKHPLLERIRARNCSVICSAPFLLAVGLLFLYKIDKSMEARIERELGERRLQSRNPLNPTFIE